MKKNLKHFFAGFAVLATAVIAAGIAAVPAQAANNNFALRFNGATTQTESEVLVFNGPALTKNFTIEADVRWDGTMTYEGILSKASVDDGTSAETGYALVLSSGMPGLALKDSTHANRVYVAPAPISANIWHTIIATYDGEFTSIYVDGTLAGTSSSFGANLPVLQSGQQVVIGREFQNSADPDLSTRTFHGDLDNIKTFDGVYPATLSPVMDYPFVEGTGRRIVDQGPLGSASWLSANNTPEWVQGSDPVTLSYTSGTGQIINRTARPYDPLTLETGDLFNRDGYVFQGWEVDGTNSTLTAGSSFVMPLSDTRINATWDQIDVVSDDTKVTLAETGGVNLGALLMAALGAALVALGFGLIGRQRRS